MTHNPQTRQDIRPSPIAGRWYPNHPQLLARSVDAYIANATTPAIYGQLMGILAPHAGHRFSGPVAGYAYKAVKGMDIDVVALIGPSHHPYTETLLTSAHDAYETPLGVVPVAHDLIAELTPALPLAPVRDDPEHALEIELPFLQRALNDFRLIPITMLDQSLEMAQQVGNALADVLRNRKALLVASSDLSHFYSQPQANELDRRVMNAVDAFDPTAVIAAQADGRKIACGHGAIAAVMIAARQLGADTASVVHYATSGDITRDYMQVVGYTSALFYQRATT